MEESFLASLAALEGRKRKRTKVDLGFALVLTDEDSH